MVEVEKIASNHYRLYAYDHFIRLEAQDLLDIMDYTLRYEAQLRREQSEQEGEEEGQTG